MCHYKTTSCYSLVTPTHVAFLVAKMVYICEKAEGVDYHSSVSYVS